VITFKTGVTGIVNPQGTGPTYGGFGPFGKNLVLEFFDQQFVAKGQVFGGSIGQLTHRIHEVRGIPYGIISNHLWMLHNGAYLDIDRELSTYAPLTRLLERVDGVYPEALDVDRLPREYGGFYHCSCYWHGFRLHYVGYREALVMRRAHDRAMARYGVGQGVCPNCGIAHQGCVHPDIIQRSRAGEKFSFQSPGILAKS
jgi:hypothetical protein